MRTFSGYLVFLLAVTLLAMAAQCNANFPYYFGDFKVNVRNELTERGGDEYSTYMDIQCSSGDDNIEDKRIAKGKTFTISFHTTILGLTTWDCDITRYIYGGVHNLFNCGYSFLKMCDFRECNWIVKNDALYLQDIPNKKYVKMETSDSR